MKYEEAVKKITTVNDIDLIYIISIQGKLLCENSVPQNISSIDVCKMSIDGSRFIPVAWNWGLFTQELERIPEDFVVNNIVYDLSDNIVRDEYEKLLSDKLGCEGVFHGDIIYGVIKASHAKELNSGLAWY